MIAGIPRRDERPLLVEREREAEVDRAARRRRMLRPARRLLERPGVAAVSTSVAAGERGASPAITMRGGPRPASASRLTTATTWQGSRARTKRAAPSPP